MTIPQGAIRRSHTGGPASQQNVRQEQTRRAVNPRTSATAGQTIVKPSVIVLMLLILASLLGPNHLVRGGPYLHKVLVC